MGATAGARKALARPTALEWPPRALQFPNQPALLPLSSPTPRTPSIVSKLLTEHLLRARHSPKHEGHGIERNRQKRVSRETASPVRALLRGHRAW